MTSEINLENSKLPKGFDIPYSVTLDEPAIPDYSYGLSQNTIDFNKQIRNKPTGAKYFSGSSSRSSSWTQTISGVGFKPKMVVIHASAWSAGSNGFSDWTITASAMNCRYFYFNAGTAVCGAIWYIVYVQAGANVCASNSVTFTSDGFSISWGLCQTTCNFHYECFG